MNSTRKWLAILGVAVALCASGARASVTIGGTRVIYPTDQREVTVKLTNDSRTPSLVQVWMDDGDANEKPADSKAPFVITPPIFRMDAGRSQTLRVMYTDARPPAQDRESLYWLNVLDIPPKADPQADTNTLQLAYRTRIKVLMRPPGLAGKAEEAPRQLTWKIVPATQGNGQALTISNPTPYYVSFSEISVSAGGRTYWNRSGGMVAPRGDETIPVPQMSGVRAGTIHYIAISDFGGAIEGDATIAP